MNFTIEADVDRRIIREKIYGIWKEDIAKNYHEEYQKVAEPLIKGKWAKLIDMGNWKSSYPEVVEVIGGHLRWCRENGMALAANVIDNPVTRGQLKRMFELGGTADISQIFASIAEADRYLRENGF
jgi:hypothetical protein